MKLGIGKGVTVPEIVGGQYFLRIGGAGRSACCTVLAGGLLILFFWLDVEKSGYS